MLENITSYVLGLDSIFGIIDEKAIVSKMGICHSCLTYFGVTRGLGTLSGLQDLVLVNVFRLILTDRNVVQNERHS